MGQKYLLQVVASLLILSISFSSCDDDSLKADIPAYLTIEDIDLITLLNQGSSSENIKDVNVFVNDQSLGIFELPANIPIRKLGNINIKIRPYIRNNGISNDKIAYPFYTTFILDTLLHEEEEIMINPVISYLDETIFSEPWSGEDFESGVNFEYHPDTDTTFVRTKDPDLALDGNSGLAMLSAKSTFFEARTPTFTNIPRDATPVFMELDYKSTHDFIISIYANNQSFQSRIVFFKARPDRTKVYISLGSTFASLASSANFSLAIGYVKPEGGTGQLVVDNVKLLHF